VRASEISLKMQKDQTREHTRRLTRSLVKVNGELVVAKLLCCGARLRGKLPAQQSKQEAAQQKLPYCPSSRAAAAANLHCPASTLAITCQAPERR